jgi:hypothetical protein
LSFSLSFDPQAFSYADLVLRSNAIHLSTHVNTSELASGNLGVMAALGAGEKFPAGAHELFELKLASRSSAAPGTYQVGLIDQPIPRGSADPEAAELATAYHPGVLTVALPSLEIAKDGPSIILSWSANAGDFTLQKLEDEFVSPVLWTNILANLQTNGQSISVSLPLGERPAYFRLQKP